MDLQLRSLFFEKSPVIFAIIDENLKFLQVNEQVAKADGLPVLAHNGKSLQEIFPYFASRLEPHIRKVISSGETISDLEVSGELPSEPNVSHHWLISIFPIRSHSGRIVAGTIGADISGRKASRQVLSASEERFRIAAQSASDLVYEWKIPTGEIDWFGDIDERLGYSPGELQRTAEGRKKLIHPEDVERVTQAIEYHLRTRQPFFEEYRVVKKDGTFLHWTDSGTALWDSAGNAYKWIGVNTDVTERRSLEEQLRQSQKMEAVGRLAGGVAHDFNNLLSVILGYSEILMRKLGPTSPFKKEVEEIKKAGNRATRLTRQLLAFSRKQVLELKVLDLNSSVSEMDKLLRRLIGEDIELISSLESLPCMVKADPGQLEQVIMNLVVNARDAMPKGGRLTLKTGRIEFHEAAIFGQIKIPPGRYAILYVSDTGCGMDAETLSKIFEPFFTTKMEGKGTGLGLSMVYGIVTQSGGYIRVSSQKNHGSMFSIYLPEVEAPLEPKVAKTLSNSSHGGSETIMVVEDEDVVRKLINEILKVGGYHILEARDGDEAVQLAKNEQNHIQLVITDVVMPRMSGSELVKKLKDFNPQLRVLYMSGHLDDAIVQHGSTEARSAFLQKPFTTHGLNSKVRELLDSPSPS